MHYAPQSRKKGSSARHAIAALVLIAAAFVAVDFFGSNASAADAVATDAGVVQMTFVDRLNAAKDNLDTDFLNSAVFATLHEYAMPVIKMDSGRHNPFAPLGGAAPAPAGQAKAKAK